jgi:hypothetical protein
MKKEIIILNGKMYHPEKRYKKIKLKLRVTKGMVQNVIELSGTRFWKIKKEGVKHLSNKQRIVYSMETEFTPYFLQKVMENLKIGHLENTDIDYYRKDLEIVNNKLPVQVQWQRGKGWRIIKRNVIYENYGGKYLKQSGIHRYNLKGVKI